jgi:hypothetical protein
MRLLAVFFATFVLGFGAVMALTWWVDPFGRFYRSDALAAALAHPGCLVSDDVVGDAGRGPFKLDVFRRRPATTVVIGTSRVLKMGPRPGETTFDNLGFPGVGAETLVPFFERLHALRPGRLTIYVGVDVFWFNRVWTPSALLSRDIPGALRYLTARQNLEESVRSVVRAPVDLVSHVQRYVNGPLCAYGRDADAVEGRQNAWRVDGTVLYTFELGGARTAPGDEFDRDLVRFEGPYYRDWAQLDPRRLRALGAALALARSYNWTIVGFTPPYSQRYVRRLATAPETAAPWREFGARVPALFRQHGYRYLDLRSARAVPCGDDEFIDDGWHPDARCDARVRRLLDRAALR